MLKKSKLSFSLVGVILASLLISDILVKEYALKSMNFIYYFAAISIVTYFVKILFNISSFLKSLKNDEFIIFYSIYLMLCEYVLNYFQLNHSNKIFRVLWLVTIVIHMIVILFFIFKKLFNFSSKIINTKTSFVISTLLMTVWTGNEGFNINNFIFNIIYFKVVIISFIILLYNQYKLIINKESIQKEEYANYSLIIVNLSLIFLSYFYLSLKNSNFDREITPAILIGLIIPFIFNFYLIFYKTLNEKIEKNWSLFALASGFVAILFLYFYSLINPDFALLKMFFYNISIILLLFGMVLTMYIGWKLIQIALVDNFNIDINANKVQVLKYEDLTTTSNDDFIQRKYYFEDFDEKYIIKDVIINKGKTYKKEIKNINNFIYTINGNLKYNDNINRNKQLRNGDVSYLESIDSNNIFMSSIDEKSKIIDIEISKNVNKDRYQLVKNQLQFIKNKWVVLTSNDDRNIRAINVDPNFSISTISIDNLTKVFSLNLLDNEKAVIINLDGKTNIDGKILSSGDACLIKTTKEIRTLDSSKLLVIKVVNI